MAKEQNTATESSDHSHKLNMAFTAGIALNFLFVVIEIIAGLYVNSLSLLSDAGHNLADVVSLALSLLAFRLMKVRSNDQYTYGYRKTSILIALLNTMFLLVSVGAIIYEAVHRLFIPERTSGSAIAIVAAVGIAINSFTAFMFLQSKDNDLNIRSAYFHLLSDALISSGIVVAGVIIYFTAWFWIDSVFSIVVAIIILFGTWKLMRSNIRLSLDGVPGNISLEKIRGVALGTGGIKGIHHLHIWAISTTENALTAHIVIEPDKNDREEQEIKNHLKFEFAKNNIQHVTLETEREDAGCTSC